MTLWRKIGEVWHQGQEGESLTACKIKLPTPITFPGDLQVVPTTVKQGRTVISGTICDGCFPWPRK